MKNDELNFIFGVEAGPKKNPCKGYIYKASVIHSNTSKGLGFSVKLVKSKQLSCPGCSSCGWLDDSLSEVNNEWPILGIEEAENGKLYTIDSCNESRDWESGIIDSFDLKLVPYKYK
jgi:hypothetical protein